MVHHVSRRGPRAGALAVSGAGRARWVWAAAAVVTSATPVAAQDTTPTAAVDAFHVALAAGDSMKALGLLAPDVVIFESGGAEMSRDEYRSHHLPADIEFATSTAREVTDRRVEAASDVAIVLTRSVTKGMFRDREIDSRGAETMILRRTGEGWRISHIHWSAR